LHKAADGPILTISDGKTATLFGGKIEGATNGEGILCGSNATLTVDGTTIDTIEKSAINANSGCKLTVTSTTICNNSRKSSTFVPAISDNGDFITMSRSRIFSNKGGGINVASGKFSIVGNVFWDNGDINYSPIGGIFISTGPDPLNRMEFNSISGNLAESGLEAGIYCSAGAGFIARNNIIWDNISSLVPQIGGSCKHAYSDIGPMSVTGTNDGGNNLNVDPMLTPDLHVMPSSLVRQKADPNADLSGIAARDIDGDPRIAPADIGADQLPRL
jgi:hypothetical protein